ncbi:MAG: UvrD-helicase domain-containing protein [Candidatus Aminicenantaceae bacterium]
MAKKVIPVDVEARAKIVQELDRTLLVEAGAGSGKTKSLVDRMLALLKEARCGISTLAAVTFTRKAAAELRGRFQTELERSVREERDGEAKDRLRAALQNLEQCYIGTIHSFCARLIRERPVEIALDPDFREMEEIEDAVYRDKCWHEFLLEARLSDDPVLERLEDVGLAPEDLRDSFSTVSLFPEVELMPGREEPPEYSYYRRKLEDFLKVARKAVPKVRPEKGWDGLMRMMRRCFFRERNLGFGDHRMLMETLELLDKGSGFKKTYWPDKESAEAFCARFEAFQDDVVHPSLEIWREYRHGIILDFLKPALDFYQNRRREQARVNYEDLLLLASRLLRDNPEVRAYFQRRYTHLLVDEFQDTDPIQAEMLMYLAGTDRGERDWRKIKPRPGSLFLVGDPKQSIYRFRRADIDTYNQVKRQIEAAGGEVLPLTANFRSLHELRDWINPVFETIFPREFTRYQAAFASLDTVHPNQGGALAGVYKLVVPGVKNNRQVGIAELDAAAIGDFIQWACDKRRDEIQLALIPEPEEEEQKKTRKPQWSDFLILFRYKKQMHVYARALEERGIPYEITGSGAFAGSEEICELVNLMQALNDPENPIFTVAALRGIFFGVSDDDLLQFKRRGGRFSFLSQAEGEGEETVREPEKGGGMAGKKIFEIHEILSSQSEEERVGRVRAALRQMREWWSWTRVYPASTALEKILETSGIVAYLAAGEMGSSRAGNLIKLLEILRGQEREGLTAFSDVAAFMSDLLSLYEIEEMSLTPGRTDAVRMMNLHKAKGLEASVVFLANPAGVRKHEPDRHIVRMDAEGPRGYFVFEKKWGYQRIRLSQPMDWAMKAEEEARYQEAEEERLMYVAATRARNALVVSTYDAKMSSRAWEALDDNLEASVDETRSTVPELEFPRERERPEKEMLMLFPGDVREGREEIRANRDKALNPSYAVDSVTSLAKADVELPVRRESAYGMSWGRVVHAVLEALGRGVLERGGSAVEKRSEGLDLLLENALAIEERDPADIHRLRNLIAAITGSEFWQRAMRSERRLFEVPFSLKSSGIELDRDHKLPVILSGVIDLVFLEPMETEKGDGPLLGWVIADYKTDEIIDDLQTYVDYYAPQVRLYSRYWARLTGQPVKETGLFFTYLNRWIPVE